jgi:hypothetical protein
VVLEPSCTFISYLHSATNTPQHRTQTWHRQVGTWEHDIDIILDSDSDEYDIDLDETDEEEDDLTGQPLNPPLGVTKQGGWTNKGAHDRATNDSSDDDWWLFQSLPQEI